MKDYYIIAHRGVTSKYPENTLESFIEIKNIKSDYKLGIEFDVIMTKDKQLVINHDQHIGNINLEELDYNKSELKLCTLKDIFEEFHDTNYLLDIELKRYSNNDINIYCELVTNLIKQYNLNYFISSFDSKIVNKLNCKQISNKNTTDKTDICDYNSIKDNCCGVYTLYDENFNEDLLEEIYNSNIIYLITDDIHKFTG